MSVSKPLNIVEVPENCQDYFKYDNQWQEQTPVRSGRNKNRTMIYARCSECGEYNPVPVNDIRNWIKGVRKQRPGTHRKCKYKGRTITTGGYVMIWSPEHPNAYQGKYMMEHVLVMESVLGRYLNGSSESVHHINGDKVDNRIENLQLRFRYHGKGQAWECNDCGSNNISPVELA